MFGDEIVLRDDAGNSYAFEPTNDGYYRAAEKIEELENQGRTVRGDVERVLDFVQPYWRQYGRA